VTYFIDACAEPGCGNIAEVFQRYYMKSTDGRVYVLRTRCLKGHILDIVVPRQEWVKRQEDRKEQ
jgi:hypothetical protein